MGERPPEAMVGEPCARALALVGLLALAGCSGAGNQATGPGGSQNFDPNAQPDIDVEATDTTGVIVGYVVDAALRTITGATISIPGGADGDRVTESNANGAFAFEGLVPGTYFLSASKAGYNTIQQAVDVVAGVSDPDPVTIRLVADLTASGPFAVPYTFDGYIECSVSMVIVGLAACSTVGVGEDDFLREYEIERPPMWAQSEMVWRSTQVVDPNMSVGMSCDCTDAVLLDNYARDSGPSPLLMAANETLLAYARVGNSSGLMIRVFAADIDGTTPSDPVNGDDCLDRPLLGECMFGVGFIIEQTFQVVTIVFYDYTPPVGWSFYERNEIPPPPK